ncbi:MAG: MTH1187 family thiamine-binding protein [Candidatus Thermoplasmatota archaeon]|nr:MTH1187 family thiamine-binding protein [Candidatus Thermoplasmatota archaeon]
MQVLAFFSISPMGQGHSVAEPVARVIELIEASGLEHDFGPMGTTILGEWDEVMDLVKRCHELLAAEHPRVTSLLKLDVKVAGFQGGVRGKVDRVRALMEEGDAPQR